MDFFKSIFGSEPEEDAPMEAEGSFVRDWQNFQDDESGGSWSSWNPLGGSTTPAQTQPTLTPTELRNWRVCFG